MQKFGGQPRCIMGDVQITNKEFLSFLIVIVSCTLSMII